ncbi:MAG: hypothetical protein CMG55_09915 [Candidatus Marinimicrobia bacterium]|nr:hypothetical protein [Candidatus Neomarinimicrobiota bacterium]|tara:strand:- start:19 stop:603 length:585 start_codon:yes stop_codon:yes gene_type:complete
MESISVFILIGGRNKRFGSAKWGAKINTHTVIERILRTCVIFDKIFLIGKKQPNDLIHLPFLKDMLEINAPINGLYTALEKTTTDWILLLSCDLPLISKDILLELMNNIHKSKNIIIPKVNGRLQPTCALYNRKLKNYCFKQIKNQELSLTKFVMNHDSHYIDFSIQSETFLNMNTKNDLRAAKKILSSKMSSK